MTDHPTESPFVFYSSSSASFVAAAPGRTRSSGRITPQKQNYALSRVSLYSALISYLGPFCSQIPLSRRKAETTLASLSLAFLQILSPDSSHLRLITPLLQLFLLLELSLF